jgi:toxin CptA
MSIAVSAIVGPSRIHRCLLAGAGLSLFVAAFAVGVSAFARFHFALVQALFLAAAGAALMHAGSGREKTHGIDFSGTGVVVLRVQHGLRERSAAAVTLLPGSVVWPPLMLLRLGVSGTGGRVQVLPVWRDSVAPGAWRSLAVAVLALGRRDMNQG